MDQLTNPIWCIRNGPIFGDKVGTAVFDKLEKEIYWATISIMPHRTTSWHLSTAIVFFSSFQLGNLSKVLLVTANNKAQTSSSPTISASIPDSLRISQWAPSLSPRPLSNGKLLNTMGLRDSSSLSSPCLKLATTKFWLSVCTKQLLYTPLNYMTRIWKGEEEHDL